MGKEFGEDDDNGNGNDNKENEDEINEEELGNRQGDKNTKRQKQK